MAPGIYQMSAEAYHADPCDTPSLSASMIKTMLSESPLHAWHQSPRLNQNYVRDDDKKFDIGTAAHSLVLEGIDNMVIVEADDWRTKVAKEARDAAYADGKTPLLVKHAEQVRQMVSVAHKAVADCADLSGFTFADGKPEQSIFWTEETQHGVIWCRSRLDMLDNNHSLILDYKTTSGSASPDKASRQVLDLLHGDIQAAMNLRGLKAITGKDANFVFMVQEIEAPYAVTFIGVSPAYLALGEDKVKTGIKMFERCLRENKWPGYGERILWAEPSAWRLNDWYEKQNEAAENDRQAD